VTKRFTPTTRAKSSNRRILSRRGFITAQPQKRPRSSWTRFEAAQPNLCWQADVTHWHLANGADAEILNLIDDQSRLALASIAGTVMTGPHVVDTVTAAFTHWGTPASMLTDNGAIFTATPRRGGRTALQVLLGRHQLHQLPALPPTDLRKNRTLPPNLKKCLTALPPAATIAELQDQIDDFRTYYNNTRPHRALQRRTPIQNFTGRPKAFPTGYQIPPHYRLRHDRIDAAGVITIRYNSRLHHIGLSKHLRGTSVTVLIDDRDIRVLHRHTGQLIRKTHPGPHPRLPTPRRQMRKLTRKPALNANDVSGHLSTISRDITLVAGTGFEPATSGL
jgi:transposase InsO family protein